MTFEHCILVDDKYWQICNLSDVTCDLSAPCLDCNIAVICKAGDAKKAVRE